MLDELSVTNLGVIASTRIEPGNGMVVVTGETGAGKTMLLGALRLLMGASARSDSIGPDGDEALVEGRFLIGDEELVVSRRVTEGRSRAYMAGGMVSARASAIDWTRTSRLSASTISSVWSGPVRRGGLLTARSLIGAWSTGTGTRGPV